MRAAAMLHPPESAPQPHVLPQVPLADRLSLRAEELGSREQALLSHPQPYALENPALRCSPYAQENPALWSFRTCAHQGGVEMTTR